MRQSQAPLYTIVIILALFMIGGFVVLFLELSDLKNEVNNLQFAAARVAAENPPAGGAVTKPVEETAFVQTSTPASTSTLPAQAGLSAPTSSAPAAIPTAIIFEARSSASLSPQTMLTVSVDEVLRTDDGIVTVRFRVYTNRASSYTALEPMDIFQIINLDGENQRPAEAVGTFASIPAKSMSEGYVTFTADRTRSTLILQMGNGDTPTFYEFNFTKKTYKETQIG